MDDHRLAIWSAHQLFARGLATGSTGNVSFREGDTIFVSKSGSCFGSLNDDSFAKISIDGKLLSGKPSKEWPMHLALYQQQKDTRAVIHTHSFYSALFSCMKDVQQKINSLFAYTPYLEMQTKGLIQVIPYAEPGSNELFHAFFEKVDVDTNTYLLSNHGVVVGATDMIKAFCLLEEVEQTCKLYFHVHNNNTFFKRGYKK